MSNRKQRRMARHLAQQQTAPQARKLKAVVFVATPVYTGQLVHQYLTSYTQSFVDCMRGDIVLAPEFAVNFSLVQYGRNWLIRQFLEAPEFTHMMWIDADLGWDPKAIRRLVEADKDVIGGSYTTKNPTKPIYPFIACGPVDENGVQEVTCLPGGFILMSRKAVQALADASETLWMEHGGQEYEVKNCADLEMVTVDDKGTVKRRALGEDYVMQVKLRALGFKQYLFTDVDFVHVGQREWHGNVAKAYALEKEAGQKTMWHEDAWDKNPRTKFDRDESRPVLVVPENEVPTPNTLDHCLK